MNDVSTVYIKIFKIDYLYNVFVLIKIYRTNLGDKKFNTLKKYVQDFISFLDNGNPLFPTSLQDSYLHNSVESYFKLIKKETQSAIVRED